MKPTIIKVCLLVISFCFLALPAIAAEDQLFKDPGAYGKLTIYSDIPEADIYVDTKFVGQDRAMISYINAGKHYVRVVKGEATIQSGLVEVRENEETIIVAKPAEEELLSRYKRQNQMQLYISYSALNYIGRKSGTSELSASLDPMIGLNYEMIFPIWDINFYPGFRYNIAAALKQNGIKVTELTIAGPYVNFSRRMIDRLFGRRNMDLNIGGGLNYSFYSGEMISITGTWGYQIFAEVLARAEKNSFIVRLGYLNYNGRGSNLYNFSNSGYFATAGLVYKL